MIVTVPKQSVQQDVVEHGQQGALVLLQTLKETDSHSLWQQEVEEKFSKVDYARLAGEVDHRVAQGQGRLVKKI